MSATPHHSVHRPALVVLVLVAALSALALGWWQWERFASSSGTAQNLGYALQWPLFAGFALFAYFRFVRLEQESDDPGAAAVAAVGAAEGAADPANSPAPIPAMSGRRRGRTLPVHEPREIPAGFLPERPRATRDDDPVLAEYNSYLARLHADDAADTPAGAEARTSERSGG